MITFLSVLTAAFDQKKGSGYSWIICFYLLELFFFSFRTQFYVSKINLYISTDIKYSEYCQLVKQVFHKL